MSKYDIGGGKPTYGIREPAPVFFYIASPSPAAIAEGNSGTTTFPFKVTRAGDLTLPVHLTWTVAGSGANPANSADFVGGLSGTLSFAAGEAVGMLNIAVGDDLTVEADEGFTVTISNPSFGKILVASASATIINDDVGGGPPPPAYAQYALFLRGF
jgi:hypothetical protein